MKPTVGRVWSECGTKPIVTINPGYSNFHIASAVNPFTGEEFTYFLDKLFTGSINQYLSALSEEKRGRKVWLIWDGAGFHRSKELVVPSNIELIPLPPYSPELNPVERLWAWLRRHVCRNRLYETLKRLQKALIQEWKNLKPALLSTLCGCSYLGHLKR